MGRRITTAAIAAAAVLSVGAGTAAAAVPSQSLSNGSKLSAKQTTAFSQSLQSAITAAPSSDPNVTPLNHGALAECTVPENNSVGYTNFFTRDTTNYSEYGGFVRVGDCSADLTKSQTTATANDRPGGRGMIPFPGTYKTYSEACAITYKGTTFYGDANSIVYKDGQFVETCIATAPDA